jgi:hypothetical protein
VYWHEEEEEEEEEKAGEEESVGSWQFLFGTEMWSSKACLQTVYLHPAMSSRAFTTVWQQTRTME